MSDTILGGDFRVYYLAENRQKRVVWEGSATGTRTVNELYSAWLDLMDEATQIDDGTPMKGDTPTEYRIGIIDPSDKEPWFIDRTTVEHLTGGALTTTGWLRAVGTATGIVRMFYTETTPLIASDIGKTIVMSTDGDTGTILDYNDQVTPKQIWIRPDSNAAANSFDNTPTGDGAFTIPTGTGAGTQLNGAATTGESLWANQFNTGLATLESNTHQYIYQAGAQVIAYKDTINWWPDGTFDVLIVVREQGQLIDQGFLTAFARQASKTYAFFQGNFSAGGRNPMPYSTGDDLNNNVGNRQFTGNTGTGTFLVGEVMGNNATESLATKKAYITDVAGTSGAPILQYYLIGVNLTDFIATDSIKGYTSLATCVAEAPIAVNQTFDNIQIVHAANETFDINEDGTTENYSVVIDLYGTISVLEAYQRAMYETRRGSLTTGFTDGIEGERYIGPDYNIVYSSGTATVNEGSVVTQTTSGATGTVVAHNTTDNILVLRNSRGTFNTTDLIIEFASGTLTGPHVTTPITPIGAAPFGIFAGGVWFLARGHVLANVPAADFNNWQTFTDDGVQIAAPNKVTAAITNTREGDFVAMFRLTVAGGIINKTEYTNTVQAAGATTVVVSTSLAADVPGKSAGGVLFIVGADEQEEYRLRYGTWTSPSTVNLASITGLTMDGSGVTETNIADTGAFAAGVRVGDLVRNTTAGAIGYIREIIDNDNATTTVITGQANSDAYEINTLPITTAGTDSTYFPLIHSYETTGTDGSPGTETALITYLADIPVLVRARHSEDPTGRILPFDTTNTVGDTGVSQAIIRSEDNIHS